MTPHMDELPGCGTGFVSVRDGDKCDTAGVSPDLGALGCEIVATRSTACALFEPGSNREPAVHRSEAVGEPLLMLALSVSSAITCALASLAPGRVPPFDAPATPEAILRATDAGG